MDWQFTGPGRNFDMQPTAETLSGIELFRNLDAADRERIVRHCKLHQFSRNHGIVLVQDNTNDVYFIVSGLVRVTMFSVTGKEVAFRDMGPGEFFGDLSAIDDMPRSSTVVTLQDSLVLSMSSPAFWEILETYPSVSKAELQRLSALVRMLSDRVFEFSTLGVQNRIHAELLRLALPHLQDDNTARITPAPRHADIASRISTHREAVTRELNHLESTGLIERSSGAIVVLDMARLSKMVEEVKGA
jgi:CRP/FNR family cyclic AMP-dependent transcriptional regulator